MSPTSQSGRLILQFAARRADNFTMSGQHEWPEGTAPQSGQDRREHSRLVLLEYARIKAANESGQHEEASSVLVDVSLGGLQVRSRKQYEQGSIVSVTIGRGDIKPIELNAEVRYSLPIAKSDLFATGLKFRDNSREQTEDWVNFVHAIFKEQGEALL